MELFRNFFEQSGFKKPEENKKVYHYEGFQEFEPYFIKLVKRLKEEIESGKYDVLISDDVGGRVPTLSLRKIIEDHTGRAPKTLFLSKTTAREDIRRSPQSNIAKFIQYHKDVGRALLVTEWAASGSSLRELIGLLDEKGVIADIAVPISFGYPKDLFKFILQGDSQDHINHNHKLFVGKSGKSGPKIDIYSPTLAGVQRTKIGTFPEIERVYKKSHDRTQNDVKEAREDVDLLAQRSFEAVWGK